MPYRSRSPLRQTPQSERISRTIAGFGRYADRRPHGLHVDASGAFRLDDLMHVWGRQEGYKEQEVLDAVRRHMFHESGGGGASALRFAIDTDSSQRIIIRVMPKKSSGSERTSRPPSPGRAPEPPPQRAAPPQLSVRTLHGSVLQQVAQGVPPPKAAPEALKTGFIPVDGQEGQAAGAGERMDVDSGPAIDEKRANVQRSCEQMGLTPETSHIRQAPQASSSARDEEPRAGDRDRDRGWGSGRRCRRGDRGGSAGEKVSRWLSWALNHGHRELMLDVDVHGWASLEALAAGLRRSRSDFGDVSTQRLQDLLEDTDREGRFEIANGRLRKLGRDRRQPRPERQALPPPNPSSAGAGDRTPGSYGRGRSRSLSSSSLRSVRRRRSPSRSASPVAAASADGAPRRPPSESGTGKPPPPPGDGWAKYQDDGRDWYYYEGPLGKWWTEEGSSDMQRYDE